MMAAAQLSFEFSFPQKAGKRALIADRNAKICAMRSSGTRVKEIAAALGMGDHAVAKVLRLAGMTNPHEAQMGPKKSLEEALCQRGPCLNLDCRKMFRGHRWQYRCADCLREGAKICAF